MRWLLSRATLRNMKQNLLWRIYLQIHWYPAAAGILWPSLPVPVKPGSSGRGNGAVFHYRRQQCQPAAALLNRKRRLYQQQHQLPDIAVAKPSVIYRINIYKI